MGTAVQAGRVLPYGEGRRKPSVSWRSEGYPLELYPLLPYSDSITDLPPAEAVGHLVNPDRESTKGLRA